MKIIAVTTGDADGIGFEVACKALAKVPASSQHQLLLFRSATTKQKLSASLERKYKVFRVKSLKEALEIEARPKQLIEILSSLPPAEWVRESAQAALTGQIDALCTGPLSKTSPGAGGGHTGIFRELVPHPLYMFFLGSKFNVLLLTDHIPLEKLKTHLTPERLGTAIVLAQEFLEKYQKPKAKLPIGVLGINPHAGEAGLLGKEEMSIIEPLLDSMKAKYKVSGPLVPDAAFLPLNWKKYSTYVACYHDQGLIPFKMIHGHEAGVHLTLGLPFVRTSVDHGTAKEIFGKNRAEAGSMIDALKWALKLTPK